MRRRHLLGGLGTALAVAWSRRPARAEVARIGSPAERLLASFRRRDSAAVVGHAYLAGHPDEARVDHLIHELDRALEDRHGPLAGVDGADLERRFAQSIRDDFAARRIVHVEGWMLSRSEARLCALAALA